MTNFIIKGNVVDIINDEIYSASINIEDGKIADIIRHKDTTETKTDYYICPGFVDSHIHIESSMLIPSEFARLAVRHGTVATVSDPHEIANVLGMEGINFMLKNGSEVPFKFFFGAPSCVPATTFETSGAKITSDDIKLLLGKTEIKYLSEMMNFPGVVYDFPDVLEKIKIAKVLGKPIDGHAPGLTGKDLQKYISAGISTDHECFSMDEALEKINLGMKVLIREGSAAKNFDELHPLLKLHPKMVMLCSDDKHPDDLVEGHINLLVKRAIDLGYNLFDVLKTVTINPVKHYNLDVGLLQKGDPADFIIVDNLREFKIIETYINGIKVFENGTSLFKPVKATHPNIFKAGSKTTDDFIISPQFKKIRVIEAIEGQLITGEIFTNEKIVNGNVISDTDNDILKIAVINRYENTRPALAFIKNFGLKKGAIASSVAHDSHNIIAVGASDEELCLAVNSVISCKGGLAVVEEKNVEQLALPVAGLMSDEDGHAVAEKYKLLNEKVKSLGSNLKTPFMTLSFMALLVIPKLKLSDKGLFDGEKFEFVDDLQVSE